MIPQLSKDKVTTPIFNPDFFVTVFLKYCKLAVRSNRKIKKIYTNHSDKHFFGNNMVAINFRFKNAVYYKIGDVKTTQNHLLIQRPERFDKLELTVYGFFQKRTFILDFESDHEKFCLEKRQFNNSEPAFG
ncbi:hypothetical protein GV828_12520 [Flavobacterium sp. NST-5]|uniref:Uncharacterized protein n=1 Tax=Flavobacterium ichthyis TaxID=2698827 RepID=A0ABW9ZBD0_9FLAO|nr:hypothetical protein [Flavobacterium ichthyis]NBL66024.1 hypothetical protein [Flavobacterium ichthyis]